MVLRPRTSPSLISVFAYTLVNVVATFFSLVGSIFYYRTMGVEKTGEYSFVVVVAGIIAGLALMGNGAFVSRAVVDNSDEQYLWEKAHIFLVGAFFLSIIFVLWEEVSPFFFMVWILLDFCIIKTLRDKFVQPFLRVEGQGGVYLSTSFLVSTGKLLSGWMYMAGFCGVELALFVAAVSSALALLWAFYQLECRPNFSWGWSGSINLHAYVEDGAPYFLSSLLVMGVDYFPILYLKTFGGAYELGIFSAAYKVVSVALMVLVLFSHQLIPYLRSLYIQDGIESPLLAALFRAHMMFAFFVAFLIYAVGDFLGQNLVLLYGESFTDVESIFEKQIWIILGSYLNIVSFAFIQAIGWEKSLAYFSAVPSLIILVLGSIFEVGDADGMSRLISWAMVFSGVLTTLLLACRIWTQKKYQ